MSWRRLLLSARFWALPLVLTACGQEAPADSRTAPPLVRTVAVQPAPETSRAFTGTVAARVQSDLGFRVGGKIIERAVDTGQAVRRGQLLMRLDPVDLKLAADAQREAVSALRARADQTAQEERRYRDLRGTGAVSASAYDQAKAAADAARAQLSAAQAQADVTRNATRYADLVADADGVVMETLAEPGQVVVAGQITLRIARSGSREAVVQLPETLRPATGSTAYAALVGDAGTPSTATLRQLSGTADRLTRTFEARYVLQGALAQAPLGSTVTVRIASPRGNAKDALQVPIGAVFDPGTGPGVWRIQGDPAAVAWLPVTLQQVDTDTAFIAAPLAPGDRIVALGAHLLHDGDRVRLAADGARP